MEKILTVVVPTYNMEKYLDRCLTSLIVEDSLMNALEVIVVNDGSKDSSSEIAHSYEAKYPQTFKVIDKENGNYGSCVNKGMDLATGKYFRILDADDWFDTENLNKFLSALSEFDSDIIVTGYTLYEKDRESIFFFGEDIKTGYKYSITNSELMSSGEGWVHMHQMTYKLDLLRSSDFYLQTGISYTDTEYAYFPLKYAQSIVFLGIILYQYYLGRDGQTMSLDSRKKSINDMFKVAMRILTDYVKSSDAFVKRIQVAPIKGLLELFYSTLLLDCAFSIKLEKYLKPIDNLVKRDAYLTRFTSSLTINDFHYVSFWRRWRFSQNSHVYKSYKTIKDFFHN